MRLIAVVRLSPHNEGIALTSLTRGGVFTSSVDGGWGGHTVTFTSGTAAGIGYDVGFFSMFVGFGTGGRLVVAAVMRSMFGGGAPVSSGCGGAHGVVFSSSGIGVFVFFDGRIDWMGESRIMETCVASLVVVFRDGGGGSH